MKEKKNVEYKWFFIEHIPILIEARSLSKQLAIEFWLDSKSVLGSLNLKMLSENENWKGYVV